MGECYCALVLAMLSPTAEYTTTKHTLKRFRPHHWLDSCLNIVDYYSVVSSSHSTIWQMYAQEVQYRAFLNALRVKQCLLFSITYYCKLMELPVHASTYCKVSS